MIRQETLLLQWFAALVILLGYIGIVFEPTASVIEGLLIGDLLWLIVYVTDTLRAGVSLCSFHCPHLTHACRTPMAAASNCSTCGTPCAGLVKHVVMMSCSRSIIHTCRMFNNDINYSTNNFRGCSFLLLGDCLPRRGALSLPTAHRHHAPTGPYRGRTEAAWHDNHRFTSERASVQQQARPFALAQCTETQLMKRS